MARTSKAQPNPNDVFRKWLNDNSVTPYQLSQRTKIAESTFWRIRNGDYMEPTKKVRLAIEKQSDGLVPASIWVT